MLTQRHNLVTKEEVRLTHIQPLEISPEGWMSDPDLIANLKQKNTSQP